MAAWKIELSNFSNNTIVAFWAYSHKCFLALQNDPDLEKTIPRYLNSLTFSIILPL